MKRSGPPYDLAIAFVLITGTVAIIAIIADLSNFTPDMNSFTSDVSHIHTERESDVRTEILDDGCVRVCFKDCCGIVSSFHLVEPKLNQLRKAWLDAQGLQTGNLK